MEANTVEVATAAHLVEGVHLGLEWGGKEGGTTIWTMDMEPSNAVASTFS